MRTRLIPDRPARVDRFDGHSRVALALADIVRGTGSGVVELVGEFGSGKSTVVELVRKNVDEGLGGKALVVVYDGWSHRAETLRRTVLATLLQSVDPGGTLGVPEAHAAVGPRATRSVTVTAPTAIAIWVGLLALVLPLAVAALRLYADDAAAADAAVRLALTVLGLGAVVAVLSSLPGPRGRSARGGTRELAPGGALLVQRVDAKEAVSEGELGSDRFERLLADVVGKWLGGGRRLVLVLDDLDRFPPSDRDHARAVLRSFHRLTSGPGRAEGFWVVVPDTPPPRPTAEEGPDGSLSVRPGPTRGGGEWTDKLYLARLTVPKALPYSSARYLRDLLTEAFPDHGPGELDAVARAVGDPLEPGSHRWALRRVNDLVALYRQHGDAPVPLRVQAAYLARSPRPDGAVLDLDAADRHRLEATLDVPEWLPLAAALYYGLPPDRAVEAFVQDRVGDAISTGDPAVVRRIPEGQLPAVLHAVERAVRDLVPNHAPDVLDNASWVVGALPDSAPTRIAWDHLLREARSVGTWEDVAAEGADGRGLGLLVHRAVRTGQGGLQPMFAALNRPLAVPRERDSVLSSLETDASGAPKPGAVADPSEGDIAVWARVAVNAFTAALDAGLEPDDLGDFRVPGKAQTYVDALRAAASLSPPDAVLSVMRPEVDRSHVVRHLGRGVSRSNGSEDLAESVRALLAVDARWEWGPLVGAVGERFGAVQGVGNIPDARPLSLGDIAQLTLALLHLAPVDEGAGSVLAAMDRDGTLLHLGALVRGSRGGDAPAEAFSAARLAVALVALLYGRESLVPPPPEELARAGSTDTGRWQTLTGLLKTDPAQLAAMVRHVGARDLLESRTGATSPGVKEAASSVLDAFGTWTEDRSAGLPQL